MGPIIVLVFAVLVVVSADGDDHTADSVKAVCDVACERYPEEAQVAPCKNRCSNCEALYRENDADDVLGVCKSVSCAQYSGAAEAACFAACEQCSDFEKYVVSAAGDDHTADSVKAVCDVACERYDDEAKVAQCKNRCSNCQALYRENDADDVLDVCKSVSCAQYSGAAETACFAACEQCSDFEKYVQ